MAVTSLRTPPLASTNEMITIYAEAAKKYWGMRGPLGQPAICSVQIWRRSQQRYIEALEAILVPPDILQTLQKAGTLA